MALQTLYPNFSDLLPIAADEPLSGYTNATHDDGVLARPLKKLHESIQDLAVKAGAGQMFGDATTKAISYNSNTISENITIPAGVNASAVGPLKLSDGFKVTISDGARFVIL